MIERAHVVENRGWNSGTQQQVAMLIARQSAKEMPGFPFVDEYLSVFGFVTYSFCETAMVLMGVREHNASNVRQLHTDPSKLFDQSAICIVGFWPDIYQRERIFLYEVNIHVTDIEWCRYRERDDLHRSDTVNRLKKRYHTCISMPNSGRCPIMIAGAGPAGSSLAIRLSRLGLQVILVERYKFPRAKLCGEFISPECLKHFDELGVFDDMLAAGGDRVLETIFYETAGRSISVPSRWLDDGGFALSLSRARMDEILLNGARKSGVTVLEETSVTGLLTNNGSVLGVKIRDSSGKTSEIEASMTIDATGRARVLSRLADKSVARKEPKPRFVGFKAHFSGVEVSPGV